MNSNIKTIIICIVAIIGVFVLLYVVYLFIGTSSKPKATNEIILYFSKDCPHCKNVEDYLKKNPKIEKKIKIDRKEVSVQQNINDWKQKMEICNLDPFKPVGVPFLYFKGQCVSGDKPITDFLTKKTK
jgi:glutaredoxin